MLQTDIVMPIEAPHNPAAGPPDQINPRGSTDSARPSATWRQRLSAFATRRPIRWYIMKRIALAILTLFLVSIVVFVALNALPGDVAELALGQEGTPERIALLRDQLGLNRPFLEQYFQWIGGLLTGDIGNSAAAQAQGNTVPVTTVMGQPLLNSLILAAITTLFFVPISLALGVFSALRAGKPSDHAMSIVTLTLSSMPEFLIGTLCVLLFFTELHLLPPVSGIIGGASPFTNPLGMVLPVLTLLCVSGAFATRLVRATTADVLDQDYVTQARLNGYSEGRVVIWRYALRNAMAPNIQVIASTIRYLLGGIIVVESVFQFPGVGIQLVSAVQARDVPVMAGIVMTLAALYVCINLIADIAVIFLIPKLRTGAETA